MRSHSRPTKVAPVASGTQEHVPQQTVAGSASESPSVPERSAERTHVGHTPVPWVKGYGPNGITGPKTPRIGGPTVQDALRAHAWERNGGAYPEPFYTVISRDRETVVIVPGDRDEREANAEFIVRACNAHEDLLAALKGMAKRWQEEEADFIAVAVALRAIAKAEGR